MGHYRLLTLPPTPPHPQHTHRAKHEFLHESAAVRDPILAEIVAFFAANFNGTWKTAPSTDNSPSDGTVAITGLTPNPVSQA